MVVNSAENAYHFGVGGAGNTVKTHDTVAVSSRTTGPSKSSINTPLEVVAHGAPRERRHFSTGVGGRGNILMARRQLGETEGEDGALARLLLRDGSLSASSSPRSTLTERERRRHTGIGGYANVHKPAEAETSRRVNTPGMGVYTSISRTTSLRGSFADSMRDLLIGRRSSSL